MDIRKWIAGCKVDIFPWIDGKHIYVNVRCYAPGQSIHQPPVWDKTVYVMDNSSGRRLVYEFTNTLVDFVVQMKCADGTKVVIDAA